MHDDTLRARPAATDPLGKCTEPVETAVSGQVKSDMTVYWRILGFGSEAEYVRSLIHRDLYGSFQRVQSIAQRAVGVNPENSREKTGPP